MDKTVEEIVHKTLAMNITRYGTDLRVVLRKASMTNKEAIVAALVREILQNHNVNAAKLLLGIESDYEQKALKTSQGSLR